MSRKTILLLGLFDTAITTSRCFSKKEYVVYGTDYKPNMSGFKSNRIISFLLPNPNLDNDKTIDFLNNWIEDQKEPAIILIPTSDEFVVFCSKNGNSLSPKAKFIIPNQDSIEIILQRDRQFNAATSCEIKVPKIYSVDDILYKKETIEFPIAIKPLNVNEWKMSFSNKGFVISNLTELDEIFPNIINSKVAFLIQQIIVGDNTNNFEVNSLMLPNGKIFQHSIQKLRQFPDGFGTATAIKSVQNTIIEELATRFIKKLNLVGFTNIEFKYNPEDGVYYYIETNTRVWLQVNFTSNIGLNFPEIYCNYLLGNERMVETTLIENGKWIDFLPDLVFWKRYHKKYSINFFKFLSSWFPFKGSGIFDIQDLKPFLNEVRNILNRK